MAAYAELKTMHQSSIPSNHTMASSRLHVMQNEIDLGDDFEPTCIAHPDTYLNKVLIGSSSGQLQLLNFASGKRLFTFSIADCSICCITPSPALDVVALGLSDGYVPIFAGCFSNQPSQVTTCFTNHMPSCKVRRDPSRCKPPPVVMTKISADIHEGHLRTCHEL